MPDATQSDITPASFRELHAALDARRPALVAAIVAAHSARLPAASSLLPERLQAASDGLFKRLIDGLVLDEGLVREAWSEQLHPFLDLGFDLAAMLEQISAQRSALTDALLDALASGIANTPAGIRRLSATADGLVEAAGAFFAERLLLFESIIEQMTDGALITDSDGTIFYSNVAAARLHQADGPWGLSRQSLVELLAVEEQDRFSSEILPYVQRHGGWHGRLEMVRPDGSPWMTATSIYRIGEEGKTVAQALFVRDITTVFAIEQERQLLYADLRQQAAEIQKFKALAEATPDGIGLTSLDGEVIYANAALRGYTGYGETLIGMQLPQIISGEERKRLPEVLEHIRTHGPWQGTMQFRRADGSSFMGQTSALVINSENDAPLAVAAIVRDISEQVRQDQELRTFFALAENAPDAIAVAAIDTRITYANGAFRALLGYDGRSEEMTIYDFFAPSERARITRVLQDAANGLWLGFLPFQRADGTTFTGQVSACAIRDGSGEVQALATITRDISEQQRLEAERLALKEQMIEAQQAALRELSTPLIPLADGIIAMPLVGSIDSLRAQQVSAALLQGVSACRARVAILDITGVPLIDSAVADALARAAQAVRLLGAQVVLTGIRPEVAQTLVGLGSDLGGIVTRSTLQSGIAYARSVA